MSEPLRLTIVDEDPGDGWIGAYIPQVRGAVSQGKSREQARENVIDALREILALRFGEAPELPDPADADSLELTIAAEAPRPRAPHAPPRRRTCARGVAPLGLESRDIESEQIAAVPRHREIKPWTARAVCRDLGIPPPSGSR